MTNQDQVKELLKREGYDEKQVMQQAQRTAKALPRIKGEATKVGVNLYMEYPPDKDGNTKVEQYKSPPEIMIVDVSKGRSLNNEKNERVYLEIDGRVVYDNRNQFQKSAGHTGKPYKAVTVAAKAPDGTLLPAIIYFSVSNLIFPDMVQKELNALGKTFVDKVLFIKPKVMSKEGFSNWAGLQMEVGYDSDEAWMTCFMEAFKEVKDRNLLYAQGGAPQEAESQHQDEPAPTKLGNTI